MKIIDWFEDKVDDTRFEDTYYALCRRKNRAKDTFRMVPRFFKNIKRWWPILLRDEQWDNGFFEDIIEHKLRLMKDFFESDDTHIAQGEVDKILKEINTALGALERLDEDAYDDLPEGFQPEHRFVKNDDDSYYLDTIYHPDFQKQDVFNHFIEGEKKRQADYDLLYDTLKKHSRGWWD